MCAEILSSDKQTINTQCENSFGFIFFLAASPFLEITVYLQASTLTFIIHDLGTLLNYHQHWAYQVAIVMILSFIYVCNIALSAFVLVC